MIKNGALSCPECDSTNVSESTSNLIIKGDKVVQSKGSCNECGRIWAI